MNGWQIFIEVPGKPPYEVRPGESIIGRSRTTQIQVADSTVSRQHARLLSTGLGELSVEDLGSSNGSWVNGEKIEGRRRLGDGDQLQVGDIELRVRIVAPVSPSEATVRMKIPPRPAAPAPPPPAPVAEPSPAPTPLPPAVPPTPAPGIVVPRGTVPVRALPEEPVAPAPPAPPVPTPPAAEAAAPTPEPPASAPPAPRSVPVPPAAPGPAAFAPPRVEPPPAAPEPPRAPTPPLPAAPWALKDDSPYATPPLDLPIEPEVDARPSPPSEVLGSIGEPEPAAAPAFTAGPVRPGSELPSVTAIDRIPIPEVSPAVVRASKLSRAQPASFGARVGAFVVDWLLVGALVYGAWATFEASLRLNPGLAAMATGVLAVVPFLYVLLFWALRGATPGKMLLGLEIVPDGPSSGRGLGVSTALVRALGYMLSFLFLGIGFLLPLFTSKKQALHDLIAKTRVVRLG